MSTTSPPIPYVNGYSKVECRERSKSIPPIVHIQPTVKVEDLKPHILEGLRANPRYLPSVLLWNADGLSLFDKVTQSPNYYPSYSEIAILKAHANDIAGKISPGSIVIELGSGNLKKTTVFLKALIRQRISVDYFALDLSESQLRHSLSNLTKSLGQSSHIRCHGLVGSYDDVASWIQQRPGLTSSPIFYLWMGNSIANHTPQQATSLLRSLGDAAASKGNVRPSFIVAVDGCHDRSIIDRAYNIKQGQSREFVLNGLKHVNAIAGQEIFRSGDWGFQGMYDETSRCYRSFYVAERDLAVRYLGEEFSVRQGEAINAIGSWKWDREQIQPICQDAGLRCSEAWLDERLGYGMYLLQPAKEQSTHCI